MLKRFMKDRSGQSMTEYILIVALIALAAFIAVKLFGTNIKAAFTGAAEKINEASG